MNAGRYSEKITVEKVSHGSDACKVQKSMWGTYYKGYTYVNNLYGKEYWAAAQTQSENTVVFTLRWHKLLDGLDSKRFRIVYKGRKYNIVSVDNVQYKNETIKIKAVTNE